MSKFLVISLSLAVFAVAPMANAATPAASAANFTGPSVAGICLLSREAVVLNAKVGLAATARLKVLADGVNAELAPEQTAIQTEAKALQDSKLSGDALKTRQQALAQRAQTLQAKAQQRQQQIELTRQKVLGSISTSAQPVIETAYKAHACGVLFSRDAVMAGGQSMDLTAEVVKGLDARMTTLSFDLEPAPQAPAAAQ